MVVFPERRACVRRLGAPLCPVCGLRGTGLSTRARRQLVDGQRGKSAGKRSGRARCQRAACRQRPGGIAGDVDADFHHQLGLHQVDVQMLPAAPPGRERPARPRMPGPGAVEHPGRPPSRPSNSVRWLCTRGRALSAGQVSRTGRTRRARPFLRPHAHPAARPSTADMDRGRGHRRPAQPPAIRPAPGARPRRRHPPGASSRGTPGSSRTMSTGSRC